MTWRQLVSRLGQAEVARRVGVSVSTLRRWQRQGPSSSGRELLREQVRRYRQRVEAAEQRRFIAEQRAAEAAEREYERQAARRRRGVETFRERVAESAEVPVSEAPKRPPATRRVKDYETPGRRRLDTYRYVGETFAFTIGRALEALGFESLVQMALTAWDSVSPRPAFCRAVFLFFRFLPRAREPHYRGERIPRDGKWVPWWTSTKAMASPGSLADNMLAVLRDARDNTIGNKVIWLEQMQVTAFDYRSDKELPSIQRLLTTPLKTED